MDCFNIPTISANSTHITYIYAILLEYFHRNWIFSPKISARCMLCATIHHVNSTIVIQKWDGKNGMTIAVFLCFPNAEWIEHKFNKSRTNETFYESKRKISHEVESKHTVKCTEMYFRYRYKHPTEKRASNGFRVQIPF